VRAAAIADPRPDRDVGPSDSRLGSRTVVRLDELPPDERAAILAAIEAKRAAKTARAKREPTPEAACAARET
jgi:hypothetical protein